MQLDHEVLVTVELNALHLFFIYKKNLNNCPENLSFVKQFQNNLPGRRRGEN